VGVFGLFALALSGFAAGAAESNKRLRFSDLKKPSGTAVLYHVDFGDPVRFAQVLNNITNHYAAYNNDPKSLANRRRHAQSGREVFPQWSQGIALGERDD
jgi:hypothetical protein